MSTYENIPAGQVTIAQAAELIGIKKTKMASLVQRDFLPTVIEADAFFPRRLLLDEVLELKYFGHVSSR